VPESDAAVDERGPSSDGDLPDGSPGSVLRRAPFSDNPAVGVRGQRAQQRILEAALSVFGELGFHPAGINHITEVAGCSRASFYQYFSSKEDVFRHLAGQVARQLTASAEALDPITADEPGWTTLHAWIGRHLSIYHRYEPVFEVFQAAAESDDVLAAGSARVAARHIASFQAKITATAIPQRSLGIAIQLLLSTLVRTPRLVEVLQAALPASSRGPDDDLAVALTDLFHRTLFGRDDAVNVHPGPAQPRPQVRMREQLIDNMQSDGSIAKLTPAGTRTVELLLKTAHDVVVQRGYHGTRVDDITSAAGVSHGAFYRYFENKDHVIRLLAIKALRSLSAAFDEIPSVAGDPSAASSNALRRWLRRYYAMHASQTAMIRVWVDATEDDPLLRIDSAAALDWGRARLVRFLEPRGFGDVDAEALLMVALLDGLSAQRGSAAVIEAGVLVIERGFLGFPTPSPTSR
jgi:AcrR family transcriptional regulator